MPRNRDSERCGVYGDSLTDDQEAEPRAIIQEFRHVFTDLPGKTDPVQHRGNLITDQPIRCRPYAIPFSVRETLRNDIKDMLRMNVIRGSESPNVFPVVIVRKPDRTNTICIDYRKLNKMTVVDPKPMTSMTDLMQELSDDKIFTKIDLSKGYRQIPIAEGDIQKTAFVTPDGVRRPGWCTYEFLKMPFGMIN